MREIKFQYIFEDIDILTWNKRIHKRDFFLEDIEEDSAFFSMCDIIARRQYTWLKDKNGKEIYEGDILYVKEEWRYWWEYNIPVEYASNWWCFWCACIRAKEISHHPEVENLFTRWFLTRNLWSFISLWEMTNWKFEFEIIWNIYENPNLLKNE